MSDQKKPENKTPVMPFCMCIGLSIGTAIGAGAGNIPLWMCVGLSVGMCLGVALDARKKNEE